jgi:hypothetical protein
MSAQDSKPEILVEEGLQLYSQGKLDQALSKWRLALMLVPEHHRAKEYLKYVEDNREALEESFHSAQAAGGALGNASQTAAASSETHEIEAELPDESNLTIYAEEPPQEEIAILQPIIRGTREGIVDEALTNKVYLLTRQRDSGEEYTPRIDLDELKGHVAESKVRPSREVEAFPAVSGPPAAPQPHQAGRANASPTPSRLTPAVPRDSSRGRRATPLTLIDGGGEKTTEDFEPLEETPVSLIMPEPKRLLGEEPVDYFAGLMSDDPVPRAKNEPARAVRETITPAKLSPQLPSVSSPPQPGVVSLSSPLGARVGSGSSPALKGPKKGSGLHLSTRNAGNHELPAPVPPPLSKGSEQLESMLASARQLYEQGTNEGALWLCERILAIDPGHQEAKTLLAANHGILTKQYKKAMGELTRIPVVQVPQHEIVWHKLDHRAGFLLSRIDGQLTYEDLLDVSGMSEFEACRILAQLIEQGVIGPRQ